MLRVICKILFLLSTALFLPRIVLLYAPSLIHSSRISTVKNDSLSLGINNFAAKLHQKCLKQNYLLVTNQISNRQAGSSYLQQLSSGRLCPKYVYSLESNDILLRQKNIKEESSSRLGRQLQIIGTLSKKISDEVGAVVIDLQDSGLATDKIVEKLLQVICWAQSFGKKLIVLDRPNPLGYVIEGPPVKVSYKKQSISLPLRYGITIGEVAKFIGTKLFGDLKITVVPMRKYIRSHGVSFYQEQKIYANSLFNLLKDVCPVEVRVGCKGRFQCFALPEYLNFPVSKWYELRTILHKYNIDVVMCRYFSRRTNQYFAGVKIFVYDINQVSLIVVWDTILKFMRQMNISTQATASLKKVFGKKYTYDFINGSLRQSGMVKDMNLELHDFYNAAKKDFIYQPWPKVMKL